MRSFFVSVLAAWVLCVAAASASPVEPFRPLLGAWSADGMAFGMPAASRMAWSETLGGKFVRLDYRIDMRKPGGPTQTFEGAGYYKAVAPGAYQGSWADNSGDLHPIEGRIDGTGFTSVWGVAGQKRGKTLYRLSPDGRLEVTDWIETKDGGWKQFNHAVFSRAAN